MSTRRSRSRLLTKLTQLSGRSKRPEYEVEPGGLGRSPNLAFDLEQLADESREYAPVVREKPRTGRPYLLEHFCVIGLSLRDKLAGVGGFRKEPRILYSYPEGVPVPYADLPRFCFPDGITVREVSKGSSSSGSFFDSLFAHASNPGKTVATDGLVFALTGAGNVVWGVCVIQQELISVLPSFVPPEDFGGVDGVRSSSRYAVASRCLCILTRLPFFDLHFAILERVLWLEHLNRVSNASSRGEYGGTADPVAERCCERSGGRSMSLAAGFQGRQHSASSPRLSLPASAFGSRKFSTALSQLSVRKDASKGETSHADESSSNAGTTPLDPRGRSAVRSGLYAPVRGSKKSAQSTTPVAPTVPISSAPVAVAAREHDPELLGDGCGNCVRRPLGGSAGSAANGAPRSSVSSEASGRLTRSSATSDASDSASDDDSFGMVRSISVQSFLGSSAASDLHLHLPADMDRVGSPGQRRRASSLTSASSGPKSMRSLAASDFVALEADFGSIQLDADGRRGSDSPSQDLEILALPLALPHTNRTLQFLHVYNMLAPAPLTRLVFQPLPEMSPIAYVVPSAAEEHVGVARFALPIMFRALKLEVVLALFAAMLLERRIIVISSNARHLSGILLSTIPLLRPLVWESVFVPVLPPSAVEVLEAPVPYAVGMTRMPPGAVAGTGTVIVDVQKQDVSCHNLPRVPRYKDLHEKLKGPAEAFRKSKGQDDRGIYAVLKVLTEYHEQLVGTVPQYTLTNVTDVAHPVSVFLKENFIASFSECDHRFAAEFVESQQFASHCDRQLARRTAEEATTNVEFITCLD